MTFPLQTLELDRVLTLIALEAKSSLGKDAIGRRRPLAKRSACDAAQADLADMLRYYHREGLLPLAGLVDVAPLLARESVLELEESWLVVRAARATQAMREAILRAEDFRLLAAIARTIPDVGELLTKLNKYFTKDGKLREEASAELRAIRQKVHQKRAAIQRVLSDVMNRTSEAIQEPLIVIRGDRYCVPVRSDHRNAVPGILHERSGSGASFFIEPMPAIELNNDLADLLIQEREEIARITRYVSQLIADSGDDILHAVAVAGELDALQACALFADATKATRPEFNDEHTLTLLDGRHPLLDERLAQARAEAFGEEPSDRKVIPINVSLDRERTALVISGPNAGGKTVALKTTGLLVAMAMSGLPVPAAEGTVIPIIDDFHVLIGDDQSVLEHLSTFSAYLMRLKRVLTKATDHSLVLLDELGSGTDPEEGSAIAAAVVEHLLDVGALMIVTTHLSALKSFASGVDGSAGKGAAGAASTQNQEQSRPVRPRIVNASMEFDSATGQPTYRMIAGLPGRSRAIDVAAMIGLPSSIIDNARARLGDRYGETDHLLAELQRRMSDVLAQQDAAARAVAQAEARERELAAAREKVEQERARLGSSYREELERLRDDVSRQVANELKSLRDMDRSARANVSAQNVVTALTRPVEKAMEFIPAEQREVHAGDRAEHRKFKVTGEVESIDGAKAVLNVNGRKMQVDTRDLVPVKRAGGGERRAGGKVKTPVSIDAPEISAELNLIGQRVDDALEESDRFLDRALLEGKQAVRIIHGFGTGKLRQAVRDHLRKHPAVKSWRRGAENEGGDGATVAVLQE